MNIFVAILIFSIIIIIHEFGHYTFARLGGIKVNEFSLGMGPRLFSFYAAGTRWSLKILPLGGSCMMEGEDEKSEDEGAFGNKSVLVRVLTVFGGPLYNFILAFVLSLFVISYAGFDESFLTRVEPNSPAAEAGLLEGDVIKSFDGKRIRLGRELFNYFHYNKGKEGPVSVVFEREGERLETTLNLKTKDLFYLGFSYDVAEGKELVINSLTEKSALKAAGAVSGDKIVEVDGTKIKDGVAFRDYIIKNPLSDKELSLVLLSAEGKRKELKVKPVFSGTELYSGFGFNTEREKTSLSKALLYSLEETRFSITSPLDGLKMLITGRVNKEELAGPIGITQIIGSSYEASRKLGLMHVLLNMSVISIIISANLGVMNLLPIPALDGGRLVFLFVEWIRRKPMDADKEGMVHLVGFSLLMILMAFLFYNDIMRLVMK